MALTPARTMPGVLELLPLDQVAFQSMLDAVRRNFERFGFLPVETPVMEYSNVLLTKEGGETERQVYEALPGRGLRTPDQVAIASGLPAISVLGPLAMLEIAGLVRSEDGRWGLARRPG